MGVFGLKHQVNQLYGTGGLSEQSISLIDYDEDTADFSLAVWDHPGEILSLAPSPSDPYLLYSVHRTPELLNEPKASLWRLSEPLEDNGILKESLSRIESLNVVEMPKMLGIRWSLDKILAFGSQGLETRASNNQIISSVSLPIQDAIWSPHGESVIGLGSGSSLVGWDVNSNKICYTLERANEGWVKSVDMNPNKPHQIGASGEDGSIRFFDLRNMSCLLEITHHSHWVSKMAYNHYHDQLVISCSTDTVVNLESIASISSMDSSPSTENENSISDGLVASFDQHEDAVYCLDWSPCDPWIFCSVSVDGRVVVNTVPSEHKYSIILYLHLLHVQSQFVMGSCDNIIEVGCRLFMPQETLFKCFKLGLTISLLDRCKFSRDARTVE